MTISRATLPAEFFDRTSVIMLRQPEPQYLYAKLLFMGQAQAELRRPGAADLLNNRPPIGAGGGQVLDLNEMQLILADDVRSEAIIVSDELAPEKIGHTIRLNRPVFTNSTYTEASRIVGSNDSISTTPINIDAEQVSITIKRVAGPYDNTAGTVKPYGIDRFDSEHSVHSLAQTVGLHMVRDRWRYADTLMVNKFFVASPNTIVFPGDATFALTADTSAFTANANGDRPMDVETLFRTEQKLQDANVAPFANGKYMCTLTPQMNRQLRSDPQFGKLAVFDSTRNPLAQSFIATIGNIEVYVSSTNPVATATVSGVNINKGIMFGPGMVGYAGAGPARVAAANEDNYGETAKVIWLCYEGSETLDYRFGVEIHSN